jgi:hypothetical protein
MYVEVGSDVGSAGNKGLIVNAPVWRGGGEVVTYLHSQAFPLQNAHGKRVGWS